MADGLAVDPPAGDRPSTDRPTCETAEDREMVSAVFRRIGDKWSLIVVATLRDGPIRFTALLRRIDGISHRLLATTLKSLERDGIVLREAYPEVPPRVEYTLTDLGESLLEPVTVLAAWVEAHRAELDENRDGYDARRNEPALPEPPVPQSAPEPRYRQLSRGDEIVVLDRGRVIEAGSHEQLMESGGVYAGYWGSRGARDTRQER